MTCPNCGRRYPLSEVEDCPTCGPTDDELEKRARKKTPPETPVGLARPDTGHVFTYVAKQRAVDEDYVFRAHPDPTAGDAYIDGSMTTSGKTEQVSKVVLIAKTQPTGQQQTPDVYISINQEIRREPTIESQRLKYAEDARELAAWLGRALPGGTMDRLVGELLARKASDFIVPHSLPPTRADVLRAHELEGCEDDEIARADLHEAARADCRCSGFRCTKHLAEDELRRHRPKVVVLCGSMRFWSYFRQAQLEEGLAGHIVLMPCGFGSQPVHETAPAQCTPEQKESLDELHRQKIDLADEVLVLNVDGYIGKSTAGEIEYAEMCGKPIRWLVAP